MSLKKTVFSATGISEFKAKSTQVLNSTYIISVHDIYRLKSQDPTVLKCRHFLDPIYLRIKKSVDIILKRYNGYMVVDAEVVKPAA